MATKQAHTLDSREGPAVLESVGIVFRLLDELSSARRPMGVTELAQIVEEPKPRVYRHLASLRQLGVVEQDPVSEKYRLGARLVIYGAAASEQFDLRTLADPYLTQIRDATGQTALLSVATNDTALVVATVESKANVCISVKPGNRVQPYCSAQGRIVLAFADEASQQRVMRRKMLPLTPMTMTDPGKLAERLELIRARLYDEADSEVTVGINALCCPIFGMNNVVLGTIGIVGSSGEVVSPADPAQLKPIQQAAAELSARLNGDAYERTLAAYRKKCK
ncbi:MULTISPECIES: IclR family transcriptional regulator [unclassified Burkholderia]|uniref:IclR family transcriptional regulator n=1 Tax=unclassified Burkholderia TaxID=2613784 RepID=UPI000F580B9D|nr:MULTISPECIES: IclR family transcriptional regulator [unclassified Burkholderia]RQS26448.1 IclR family transcriptional regulator [Burkholderia sp. Bp8995]RQS48426.1 IclR family transcriptional regulator [Burkholderia sp. Bp8989]